MQYPVGGAHTNLPEATEIPAGDPLKFDPRIIVLFLQRQWKTIALITLLGLAIASGLYSLQAPKYSVSADLMLTPPRMNSAVTDELGNAQLYDPIALATQVNLIESPALLRRVVKQENLVAVLDEMQARKGFSLKGWLRETLPASFAAWLPFMAPRPSVGDRSALTPEQQQAEREQDAIQWLRQVTSVSQQPRSYVITISVTLGDPVLATRIANAIADAYIVDQFDVRLEDAQRASNWLSERVQNLREQVRASEEAVVRFRTEHNLTQAGQVSMTEQQLSDFNGEVAAARKQVAELKVRLDQANRIRAAGGNMLAIPDVARSESLGKLRTQLAEVSQKQADLTAQYGARYPLLVNTRAQRADIEGAIAAEINRIFANLQNDYDAAVGREKALTENLQALTGQNQMDEKLSVQLRELERTAEVNKALLGDFLSKAKLTDQYASFQNDSARVISPAVLPLDPSAPRLKLFLLGGLLGGAMLGLGIGLLREMLKSGVMSAQQLEMLVHLPVLSSIQSVRRADLKADDRGTPPAIFELPAAKPLGRFSESVRMLRAGIQMSDVDHPPRVILVTSSVAGEGKSTLSSSLAMSLTTSGASVLLIDGDLRKASASKLFGIDKQPGIVEVLVGTHALHDVIVQQEGSTLKVLPVGSKTQTPSDLLASEKMVALLRQFRGDFDYVIIDSPPLVPVVDALTLLPLIDKLIYVVRWDSTPRSLVLDGLRRIPDRTKVAGVVLSMVDLNRAHRYGYGYGYGYGYSYYSYNTYVSSYYDK